MARPTITHPYASIPIPSGVPVKLAVSPGRGWGAFATRNITSGTAILREAALFTIHKHHDIIDDSDIRAAIHALPASSQQRFYSLRDNGGAQFRSFTEAFSENCFGSTGTPVHGGTDRIGCYILMSRFNHSCVPNAKIPDTATEGASIVCFATRDIAKGEEIMFCYNTDFMCRTSRDRHRELRFVCECKACRPGGAFHQLSEMRRTMIRGLQYLLNGRDFDGKRGACGRRIIADAELRVRAEKFDIGVADRFVYTVLTMVLLEQEGLLDKLMLERMQRGIWPLIMALETSRNLSIFEEVMATVKWEDRFGECLKLWGRKDAGDKALRSRLQKLDRMRG